MVRKAPSITTTIHEVVISAIECGDLAWKFVVDMIAIVSIYGRPHQSRTHGRAHAGSASLTMAVTRQESHFTQRFS
jgi:hypothetical protein